MTTSRFMAIVSAIFLLQLTAIAADTSENEPGTYKITGGFKGVSFSREVVGVLNNEPQHAYAGISGSGVLKNDKDEVIAEGELQAVEGFLGLRAKKDATFFYVPLQERYSSPGWRQKPPSQFATLRYGKDNRWQIIDTNFLFLIEPGGFGSVSLKPTASITRYSVIQLPAGTLKMFGYTIKSDKDGATVKFSYGKVVGTKDCTAIEDKSSKP